MQFPWVSIGVQSRVTTLVCKERLTNASVGTSSVLKSLLVWTWGPPALWSLRPVTVEQVLSSIWETQKATLTLGTCVGCPLEFPILHLSLVTLPHEVHTATLHSYGHYEPHSRGKDAEAKRNYLMNDKLLNTGSLTPEPRH